MKMSKHTSKRAAADEGCRRTRPRSGTSPLPDPGAEHAVRRLFLLG